MADETKTKDARQDSDVKQSFAWGQLFVGSILAGFSVYQLGLKAMRMPPSEMLAGLSEAYASVREFLALPFSWLHLELSASDKDVIVACLILVGALVRALVQYPTAISSFATSAAIASAGVWWSFLSDVPTSAPIRHLTDNYEIAVVAMSIATVSLLLPLTNFILSPFGVGEARRGVSRLVLGNILFTVFWGTVLLLLNWATS